MAHYDDRSASVRAFSGEKPRTREDLMALRVRAVLGEHVRIASEPSVGQRTEDQERVALNFETEYEALAQFSAALIRVLDDELAEATLQGRDRALANCPEPVT